MFQPLYVAATGLSTFEDEMADITNNLANAKTIGFKSGRIEKESLFYVQKSFNSHLKNEMDKQDEISDNVIEFGSGVRIVSTPKDFSQGTLEITNKPLDVAIQGDGFFQFRLANGKPAYGRSGNFHADNDGNIVDPNGRFLDPPLNLPSNTTSILIRQDGTVFASINNSSELTEIGQMTLAKFSNPAGLKSLGQNLYEQTTASGEAFVGNPGEDGFGLVTQSSIEQSNVDVVSEMMRMIMSQRVFDTVTKAVSTYEGMLAAVEKMKS